MARTDVQLMLDVKAGDEASFELLLHRYRTPLVNFLFRMVRNREQAEDLAQEVFLRVYRAREDYVPSAKFTTWMFRIATNLALNSVRDNRYHKLEDSIDAPVRMDAEDGDDKVLDVADKHPNIEQHLVEVHATDVHPQLNRRRNDAAHQSAVRRSVGDGALAGSVDRDEGAARRGVGG